MPSPPLRLSLIRLMSHMVYRCCRLLTFLVSLVLWCADVQASLRADVHTCVRDLHRIRHNAKYSEFGLWEQQKAQEVDLQANHALSFAVHRAFSQVLGRPSPPLLTMSTALGLSVGTAWMASKFIGPTAFLPAIRLEGWSVYCGDFHALSQYQATQYNRSQWHRLFERGNDIRNDLLREYRTTLAAYQRGDQHAAVAVSQPLRSALTDWKKDYSMVHGLGTIPPQYYNIGREELNKV